MKRLKKVVKRIMLALLSVVIALVAGGWLFLQHPEFGKSPSGARLERIRKSPNYRDGKFWNTTETPTFAEGHSFWGELRKSIFMRYPDRTPREIIPSVKTNLLDLPADSTSIIWFGHSSCLIQTDGKRILIDPVFSANASPVPGFVKAFAGASTYTVSDFPEIDYLLISHDHYDHLDYETALALKDKTKKVICGLGVGAHFERWGYAADQIIEKDWHEKEQVDSTFVIYAEPARHKSGRGVNQNNTLWLSFFIQSSQARIYVSGDTGYDNHFKEIGDKFGPIDLAILENGQYDSAWHYVHLLPEETMQAGRELKAKKILPVHHSKFVLARHRWNEPLQKVAALDTSRPPILVTPMIGEAVHPDNRSLTFGEWWKRVDKIN